LNIRTAALKIFYNLVISGSMLSFRHSGLGSVSGKRTKSPLNIMSLPLPGQHTPRQNATRLNALLGSGKGNFMKS